MKTNTLIPIIVSAAICGVILFVLAGKNKTLAKELDAKREQVAGLERQAASPGSVPGEVSALNPIAPLPGSVEAAVAETRANTTPEERIARAVSQIDLLVADIGDVDQSPAELFKVLPDLLRIVQDLDLDEMIAVAGKLDAPLTMGSTDGKGAMKMILMMLAAEQDPQRVLENPEIGESRELRGMVLNALARQDPKAARAWLAESDLSQGEKKQFEQMMIMQVLRTDFAGGIDMIRKGGPEAKQMLSMLQMMPMSKDKLPGVFAAIENPENSALKPQLVSIAIGAAIADGGIEAAKVMVEERGMAEAEVASFLNDGVYRLMDANPVEALQWMTEVQSEDQLVSSIPNAIQIWARKDYNAAGEWIGKLEPSPVKDSAIGKYSNVITGVDPQAAAIWATQIQDEEKRQTALEHAGRQWQATDPAAAAAWFDENDIDVKTIIRPPTPTTDAAPE